MVMHKCRFVAWLIPPIPWKGSTMLLMERELELPFVPARDQVLNIGMFNGTTLPRLKVLRTSYIDELEDWEINCYPMLMEWSYRTTRFETGEALPELVKDLEEAGWLVTKGNHSLSPEEHW